MTEERAMQVATITITFNGSSEGNGRIADLFELFARAEAMRGRGDDVTLAGHGSDVDEAFLHLARFVKDD